MVALIVVVGTDRWRGARALEVEPKLESGG